MYTISRAEDLTVEPLPPPNPSKHLSRPPHAEYVFRVRIMHIWSINRIIYTLLLLLLF